MSLDASLTVSKPMFDSVVTQRVIQLTTTTLGRPQSRVKDVFEVFKSGELIQLLIDDGSNKSCASRVLWAAFDELWNSSIELWLFLKRKPQLVLHWSFGSWFQLCKKLIQN